MFVFVFTCIYYYYLLEMAFIQSDYYKATTVYYIYIHIVYYRYRCFSVSVYSQGIDP